MSELMPLDGESMRVEKEKTERRIGCVCVFRRQLMGEKKLRCFLGSSHPSFETKKARG